MHRALEFGRLTHLLWGCKNKVEEVLVFHDFFCKKNMGASGLKMSLLILSTQGNLLSGWSSTGERDQRLD